MFFIKFSSTHFVHISFCTDHIIYSTTIRTTVRADPLTMMCQAQLTDCDGSTSYPLKNLTAFLRNEIHRPYNLLYDNCQSFTKRLFDEVVKENIWDPLPPFYFLFDSGIEYFFSLMMELAIVFKSILACTLCKGDRKHLKFVCFTYVFWLTTTDISKVCLEASIIPNLFTRTFIGMNYLFESKVSDVFLLGKCPSFLLTFIVCFGSFWMLLILL